MLWRKIASFNMNNGLENFPVELQGLLKKRRVKKPTVKDIAALRALKESATEDSDDEKESDGTASSSVGKKLQQRFFILQVSILLFSLLSHSLISLPPGRVTKVLRRGQRRRERCFGLGLFVSVRLGRYEPRAAPT